MPAERPVDRPVDRTVDRVEKGLHVGPDAEVDDKWLYVRPPKIDTAPADPFLALSQDWFAAAGFDWHPHRGLDTVTVVLDGVLEHADNLGNAGLLAAGDVQWTTAGRGLMHREVAYRHRPVRVLQLWLNLPAAARLCEPAYRDVVSGTVDGVAGPVRPRWPVRLVLVTVEPGGVLELPVPAADRAFALVWGGSARIGGEAVPSGSVAWSEPVARISSTDAPLILEAPRGEGPARIVVGSGPPVGEPVVVDGPFAMGDRDEIEQAQNDYRVGAFGPVPRLPRW
jgi:redox-sensitive bicupin YhaK (pirin superfamily)